MLRLLPLAIACLLLASGAGAALAEGESLPEPADVRVFYSKAKDPEV